MDFNSTLFLIDSQLIQDDLESLRFLCLDLLPNKKLLAIKSNLELFQELRKHSLIEEDKLDLLAELLYIIGQHSLIRNLGTSKAAVQEALKTKRTVSSYRQMLFELSEDIASEDQRSVVFLLNIPKKYEENKKFLDVLCYLEKNDQLSEDKLDVLENALCNVSPEQLRKINDFKLRREIEKPRSQSLLSEYEYDDKTALSTEARQDPAENKETETTGEFVQQISESVDEKALMTENPEKFISDLTLNEQPKPQIEMYRMNRKHRGYCLIINNSIFMKSEGRQGTEKDVDFLTKVFTWLGLDVEIRNELSTQQIHNCLVKFSKKDHSERDCFVCCILTHGKSQEVFGTDNETIPITKVTSYFSAKNCRTLVEKPKLFFIQACQGKGNQGAHAVEPDAVSVEEKRPTITIPNDADLLIGMSTVDGYYSFRDIRKGSWYIQTLCDNLTTMVPKGEDVLSILTKVNKDVSDMEYYLKDGKTNMKQMPQPSYTLRRKLVFPKPLAPFNQRFQETN